MWADVALVLGAYILGSMPHLPLIARLRRLDLEGDYHENLWNRAGKLMGVIGVIGEFIKGMLPVLIGRALGFDIVIIAIAGVAAVFGQMWPVFSRFDGEKGNSIAIAVTLALVPIPALVALVAVVISLIFRTVPRLRAKSGPSGDSALIGGGYSRSLPLGMFACFLLLPFTCWYFGEPPGVIWCCAALYILIMIRRLTAGLSRDLKESSDIKGILLRRFFYDRATTAWRR